jgi:hypothetical protein
LFFLRGNAIFRGAREPVCEEKTGSFGNYYVTISHQRGFSVYLNLEGGERSPLRLPRRGMEALSNFPPTGGGGLE